MDLRRERFWITMPHKLDLFVLTFNAAKAFIDSVIFSYHIETGLKQNSTGLPDVVVFSLQEVSPLGYAFVGAPLLSPYLAKYEDALNMAAARLRLHETTSPVVILPQSAQGADVTGDTQGANSDAGSQGAGANVGSQEANAEASAQGAVAATSYSSLLLTREFAPDATTDPFVKPWPKGRTPYTLVRQHNVGMTAIMVFARDPETISEVEVAEVGFGIADMGNKGAVAIRLVYKDPKTFASTAAYSQMTFVATHLAPMEWNLSRRNANWRSIVSGLLFDHPVAVIKQAAKEDDDISLIHRPMPPGRSADSAASRPPTPEEEAEAARLLRDAAEAHDGLGSHIQDALREISIFRPGSYLFVAGDLNYRISLKSPDPGVPLPNFREDSEHHWRHYLDKDQLTAMRERGIAFQGLAEADICFPPTYKYEVMYDTFIGAVNEEAVARDIARTQLDGYSDRPPVIAARYANHRWPSWCDRILYLDTSSDKIEDRSTPIPHLDVVSYRSLPIMESSDHQPVYLRMTVPLVRPAELDKFMVAPVMATTAGSPAMTGGQALGSKNFLYPVDIHARARRAVARRRELFTGWNLVLFWTREGYLTLISAAAIGMGTYWLWQAF